MQKSNIANIGFSYSSQQDQKTGSIAKTNFSTKNYHPNFTANPKENLKEEIKDDFIYEPTLKNKNKAKLSTAKSIPSYVKRGISGDPNSNFHEFMQITKIPYFLGGPGLVATVLAGQNLFDIRANKSAKFNAKGMALGCALYYVMVGIAKKCVDVPVKALRGIDLNHPYVDVVYNNAEDASGKSSKRYENHNVFESSKFIRWDLLYNEEAKNPRKVNSKYNEIAKKMNMPEDINDSDSAVRPVMMSLIKQSRAWKYIIGAFAVMLGVGLGNQKALKEEFCTGTLHNLKENIIHKSFKPSIKNATASLKTKVINPIKNSFVSLWKGTEISTASKYTGKVAIIGFLASVLMANISILKSTDKKNPNFIKTKEANQ